MHAPVGGLEEEIEIVVLIKATPEIGLKHGETVCVAGVDAYGAWHRLYPVPYRDLRPDQKFVRWDRIRVRWRPPAKDDRIESKRVDPRSFSIIGKVTGDERSAVAERATVGSLEDEMAVGRSLALIQRLNPSFVVRRLSKIDVDKSNRRRKQLINQTDMFAPNLIAPSQPPFSFSYRFDHAGRSRLHQCIDWETEQTFLKWRTLYGEEDALKKMRIRWGEEMPQKGLFFAMGTHRVRMFKSWLLSGLIQAKATNQARLF